MKYIVIIPGGFIQLVGNSAYSVDNPHEATQMTEEEARHLEGRYSGAMVVRVA